MLLGLDERRIGGEEINGRSVALDELPHPTAHRGANQNVRIEHQRSVSHGAAWRLSSAA